MADEYLTVQISSALKGRVSIFDSADEPDKLTEFAQRFTEGQPIECRVSQVAWLNMVRSTCCIVHCMWTGTSAF